MTKEQKDFVKSIGKCELCGSKRNLELHHIIPMVCQHDHEIDLDVEDNWIVLCGSCHAKLTPKKMLTKYGISNCKENNKKILMQCQNAEAIYKKFCLYIQDFLDAGERPCVDDYFDAAEYAAGIRKERAV